MKKLKLNNKEELIVSTWGSELSKTRDLGWKETKLLDYLRERAKIIMPELKI